VFEIKNYCIFSSFNERNCVILLLPGVYVIMIKYFFLQKAGKTGFEAIQTMG